METIFNHHPVSWVFGFHTEKSMNLGEVIFREDEDDHIYLNIATALSWIPGISIITTIFKLFVANQIRDEIDEISDEVTEIAQTFAKAYAIRAVLDLFFGPIFFIIDMIVTIGRLCLLKEKVLDSPHRRLPDSPIKKAFRAI